MPETEALLPRFRAAHTQVLGVSVDSVYSHANWARDLGGISFPLLSDFEPKGGMAKSYGLYLDGPGITDRATVVIDSEGVVRYAASVGPGGRRTIADLAAECEKVDAQASGLPDLPTGSGIDGVLYVKSKCGPSRSALLARDNLHLDSIAVKNVSEDPAAHKELIEAAGKDQAPCLVSGGEAVLEAEQIVARLAAAAAPLP
ncbi:MAG: hypothetical protein D6731_17890 [Planctomycetota bacterium]|nr:MAG: hypothetical protein D6731_17890 [Planctomycetota bacterium]